MGSMHLRLQLDLPAPQSGGDGGMSCASRETVRFLCATSPSPPPHITVAAARDIAAHDGGRLAPRPPA
jgi:hypothetical protein